jgi:hypothetical protein
MSHMGKARKIFNKKLAFPPFLFDKPRFFAPGSVRAFSLGRGTKNGANSQPVRIRPVFCLVQRDLPGCRGRQPLHGLQLCHLDRGVQRDLHLVRKTP